MARRGFTLVEMLVVIAVLAVLAGASFAVFRTVERARVSLTETRIHTIRCEVKKHVMLKGSAPATLDVLAKALDQPGMMKDGKFVDAWERPLRYSAEGKEFRVWSCGPDGVAGTEDDVSYEKN